MKKLLIIVLLVNAMSCSTEDIVNSKGTQLVSIQYIYTNTEWKESYRYNSEGLLDQVKIPSVYDDKNIEITYVDGKPGELLYYNMGSGRLISRDSITYNSLNKIDRISYPSESF